MVYKEVAYPNAIAIISYYRNIGPKTPMNTVALTGFESIKLAHDKNNKRFEAKMDNTQTEELMVQDLMETPSEFALYKEKVAKMLTLNKVDASAFTDAMYKQLLQGEKVNGVTLDKEFFKAFNGPCFNEALVMNLIGLHIEMPTTGTIYVGMNYTDNYQSANSFKL